MEEGTLAQLTGLADVWSANERTVLQWLHNYFDGQKDLQVNTYYPVVSTPWIAVHIHLMSPVQRYQADHALLDRFQAWAVASGGMTRNTALRYRCSQSRCSRARCLLVRDGMKPAAPVCLSVCLRSSIKSVLQMLRERRATAIRWGCEGSESWLTNMHGHTRRSIFSHCLVMVKPFSYLSFQLPLDLVTLSSRGVPTWRLSGRLLTCRPC